METIHTTLRLGEQWEQNPRYYEKFKRGFPTKFWVVAFWMCTSVQVRISRSGCAGSGYIAIPDKLWQYCKRVLPTRYEEGRIIIEDIAYHCEDLGGVEGSIGLVKTGIETELVV